MMKIGSANKSTTDYEEPGSDKPENGHGRSNRWFWILVIGVIALVQWPALKELYYQFSGSEFPEQTIRWHHDLASAMEIADNEKRPILAVFGASWCPPCRAMRREVWPNPQVSAAIEAGFVALYVDVDDRTQAELVSRYRVSGIPAVLLLDREGNVVSERKAMSLSETLTFLTSVTNAS